MKFGKTIKAAKRELPFYRMHLIINYSLLKKLLKQLPFSEGLANIGAFSRRVDDSLLRCNLPMSELLRLIELNAIAVRKLTKKLDKKFQSTEATQWYHEMTRTGVISFLSSYRHTVLQSVVDKLDVPKCSCCFSEGKVLLLGCNHFVCKECLRKIEKVNTHTCLCPVCRSQSQTSTILRMRTLEKYRYVPPDTAITV